MTEYYIDSDGNDSNSGTSPSDPFATFAPIEWDGRLNLSGGDRVFVRGGIIEVGSVNFYRVTGEEGNPIVIQGYKDENAVIDFSSGDGMGFKLSHSQHFVFRDLEVRNAAEHNFQLRHDDCFDFLFERLDVHGHGRGGEFGGGISVRTGANDVTIRDSTFHNSYSTGGNSDGIRAGDGASNILIEDCEIWNNEDDGIDFFDLEVGTGKIRRCVSHHNGFDKNGTPVGDGSGFKLGPGGGHSIERCVSYRNRRAGFNNNTAQTANVFYNCTAWDNGQSGGWRLHNDSPAILRNCLAYENVDGPTHQQGSSADIEYCSWTLSEVSVTDASFQSVDPGDVGFLVPASESDLINKGVDVGLDYEGSEPDLGAYVYRTSEEQSSPELRVYDGTTWQRASVKYFDGSQFVPL